MPAAFDPGWLALGLGSLDRRADLRTAGWGSLPQPRRFVLLDGEGRAAVRPGEHGNPAAVTVLHQLTAIPGPDPDRDIFLGIDDSGAAVCGRVVEPSDPVVPTGIRWSGLRAVGTALGDLDREALATMLALANWHRTHGRCPRCGAPTDGAGMGWWRSCPQDGSDHFPRTDPAVIAVVVDQAGSALLGHQVRWPPGAFSTLAGFVEPGESAEAAVRREIAEEVGLRPDDVEYVGSQPWPFPGSLMLGYRAGIRAVRPEPVVDGVEIAEALWLSRDELPVACAEGRVRLPGRLSIAHHLIRSWFGAEIPAEWCRW